MYSRKCIKDTIYWLSSDYQIILNKREDNFTVECLNSDNEFKSLFLQKLNDFSLRETITSQTQEIKSLVVAKAFYPEMVNFKNIGEFEDPVSIERRNEK